MSAAIAEYDGALGRPARRRRRLPRGVPRQGVGGLDFADARAHRARHAGPVRARRDPKVQLKKRYVDEQNAAAARAAAGGGAGGGGGAARGRRGGRARADGRRVVRARPRAVSQAVGADPPHDYGAILCTTRFAEPRNRAALSAWVRPHLALHERFADTAAALPQFFRTAKACLPEPARVPPPRRAPRRSTTAAAPRRRRGGGGGGRARRRDDAATAAAAAAAAARGVAACCGAAAPPAAPDRVPPGARAAHPSAPRPASSTAAHGSRRARRRARAAQRPRAAHRRRRPRRSARPRAPRPRRRRARARAPAPPRAAGGGRAPAPAAWPCAPAADATPRGHAQDRQRPQGRARRRAGGCLKLFKHARARQAARGARRRALRRRPVRRRVAAALADDRDRARSLCGSRTLVPARPSPSTAARSRRPRARAGAAAASAARGGAGAAAAPPPPPRRCRRPGRGPRQPVGRGAGAGRGASARRRLGRRPRGGAARHPRAASRGLWFAEQRRCGAGCGRGAEEPRDQQTGSGSSEWAVPRARSTRDDAPTTAAESSEAAAAPRRGAPPNTQRAAASSPRGHLDARHGTLAAADG